MTSRRRQTAELYTRHFGIGDLFESMVTPEDTSRHKPDAAPARLALARLEVEPSAALFVGDARFDIECGRAAGTATCLVAHPARADAYEGPEADYVIRNLAELTE